MYPHVEFVIMETIHLSKNINYVPGYFSGLSRALLCFFPTTFLEIAVYDRHILEPRTKDRNTLKTREDDAEDHRSSDTRNSSNCGNKAMKQPNLSRHFQLL